MFIVLNLFSLKQGCCVSSTCTWGKNLFIQLQHFNIKWMSINCILLLYHYLHELYLLYLFSSFKQNKDSGSEELITKSKVKKEYLHLWSVLCISTYKDKSLFLSGSLSLSLYLSLSSTNVVHNTKQSTLCWLFLTEAL